MSFRLGLTGSIGMGKSTTAQMFADLGCALWDADAAVGRLYGPNGAALAPLAAMIPDIVENSQVNRNILRSAIQSEPGLLTRVESIVHPLVRQDRENFAANAKSAILVFDIPLLFETGSDTEMDAVACVCVSAELQRERVLQRGTMSEADLELILSRQMPNDEKCARSTYVIPTDTMQVARIAVAQVVADINNRIENA